jgi:hypothetical protein
MDDFDDEDDDILSAINLEVMINKQDNSRPDETWKTTNTNNGTIF